MLKIPVLVSGRSASQRRESDMTSNGEGVVLCFPVVQVANGLDDDLMR